VICCCAAFVDVVRVADGQFTVPVAHSGVHLAAQSAGPLPGVGDPREPDQGARPVLLYAGFIGVGRRQPRAELTAQVTGLAVLGRRINPPLQQGRVELV
jgi:hypothetical protein